MSRYNYFFIMVLSIGIAWLIVPLTVFAGGPTDNASDAVYATWDNGDNGGSGFNAWILNTTSGNSSENGFFVGTSATNGDGDGNSDGDINSGSSQAWGLYANSNQTASAVRPFNTMMVPGDIFYVRMDNGWVNNAGGSEGTVGFGLQNSSNQNLMEFYFIGGQTNYTVNDSANTLTGLAFTDEGLAITMTLITSSTYRLQVTGLVAGTLDLTRTLASPGGGQTITQARFFNYRAGSGTPYNLFFNNLGLTSAQCWATPDNSATVYGSTDAQAVRNAISAASAGDTVKVAGYCAGAVTDSVLGTNQVITVTKALTIAGGYTTTNWTTANPGVYTPTLDALGGGRVITANAALTMTNITIQNGSVVGAGSGVNSSAALILTDVNVYSNTAHTTNPNGGGVYGSGGVWVSGGVFQNNRCTATCSGGGVGSQDSPLTITGTRFISNSSFLNGGAAWGNNNITITNAYFERNQAWGGQGGGAVASFSSTKTLQVINSIFVTNTASTNGGAILQSGAAYITGNTFVSNTAGSTGGGVRVVGVANVTATTFMSNTSNSTGGGAHFNNTANVTGTTFSGNTANTQGGGAYANGALMLSSSWFTSNIATNNPGGGAWVSGAFTDTGSVFYNNRALTTTTNNGFGGGLLVNGAATLTGTQFISNSATKGGGAYFTSTGTLTNVTVSGNAARDSAGGLYVVGTLKMLGGALTSNTAITDAGGLYGAVTMTLIATTFTSNTAGARGGGAFLNGASNLTATTFTSNTATTDGGGAWFNNPATVTSTTFTGNTANGMGGGALFGYTATVTATTFAGNLADVGGGTLFWDDSTLNQVAFLDNTATQKGGGVSLEGTNGAYTGRWQNVLLAGNAALTAGGGLYVNYDAGDVFHLQHTTLASPTVASGAAIYVVSGTVNITNSIIASHTTGIQQASGIVAENYNLFYGNSANTSGSVTSGGNSLQGSPAFYDTTYYTLTNGSLAVNMGTDLGITTDYFGDTRPYNALVPDMGYDESPYNAADSCYAKVNSGTLTYISSDAQAVRDAVSAATAGDTVKVAGYCAGVANQSGTDQVALITKTLTIVGGYTTTNWSTAYPTTQTTTLDALGSGRVISANVAITLQGFTAMNGYFNAGGSTLHGGGIYASGALTLTNMTVYSNVITGTGGTQNGGGVYVGGAALITTSTIMSNSANSNGGGLQVSGAARLTNTQFISNSAAKNGGGGYFGSGVTADNIQVLSNTVTAGTGTDGGGGFYLSGSNHIANSLFQNNRMAALFGGGIYLANGVNNKLWLTSTQFISNLAKYGGGLEANTSSAITVTNSQFLSNTAFHTTPGGNGGGINHEGASALITGTLFQNNQAINSDAMNARGGGLRIAGSANAFLTNTQFISNSGRNGGGISLNGTGTVWGGNLLLARNVVTTNGAGIYVHSASNTTLHLIHTTIASPTVNTKQGIYVVLGTAYITNTIIVSHSMGIAQTGGTVSEDYNLFYGNSTANLSGVITSSGNSIIANPAFYDTSSYTLTSSSWAIDRGTNLGITSDYFGETRPQMASPDIGYDESPDSAMTAACYAKVNSGALMYVSADAQAVRDAISAASAGDTVKVAGYCAGVSSGQVANVTKVLTIAGGYTTTNWTTANPGVYTATLDALGGGRVINASQALTVTDIQLQNGVATGTGGGLNSSAALVLSNVIVYSNTATANGGGVYVTGATILTGTKFISNVTTVTGFPNGGGGAYVNNTLVMTNSTFMSNTSGTFGGGLWGGNRAILSNSTFISNTASTNWGGGAFFYNDSQPITLTAVTFTLNNAASSSGRGGGLFTNNDFSSTYLSNTTFISNTAGDGGGAQIQGVLTIEASSFVSNTARKLPDGTGGGLYASNTALITNSSFSKNITLGSTGHGGGARFGNVTLYHVSFTDNAVSTSGAWGGGAYITGVTSMSHVTFTRNSAVSDGGAIYLSGSNARQIVNALFARNHAGSNGAAIYVAGANPLQIIHTTIASPTQSNKQGIYVNGGTVYITNTIVTSHSYGIHRAGGTVVEDYNLFYGNSSANLSTNITSGGNSVGGDPMFVSPSSDNYKLSNGSWAVNYGTNLGVTSDFEGDTRPYNALVPDIGYDESPYNQATGTCYAKINSGLLFVSNDALAVREAITNAVTWDTVKVAGYCVGVATQGGTNQVALITKAITIAGGYTTTNWTTAYPTTQTTTLDALGGGRVISANMAITLQGFTATNGYISATNGTGGGIYATGALTLSHMVVYSNVITGSNSQGGGVYFNGIGSVTGTTFMSNTTAISGGGLYAGGAVYVTNTTFSNNTSSSHGGGLYANNAVTLTNGTFSQNSSGRGGGLYVNNGTVSANISNTTFTYNQATTYGGGLFLGNDVIGTLDKVSVLSNTVNSLGGGGAVFATGSNSMIRNSNFVNNTSNSNGGGILFDGAIQISNTTFMSNAASISGGALYFRTASTHTITNSLFARNQANTNGAAIYVVNAARLSLVHATIASPTVASNAAVYVANGTVNITNSIIASHTYGITQTGGTVRENYNLFYGNNANTSSSVISGGNSVTGNPTFYDTTSYTLTSGSAAINMGMNLNIATDFEGETRPQQDYVDMGYDESPYLSNVTDLAIGKTVVPTLTVSGQAVTYTISLTNSGADIARNIVITDIVPMSLTNLSYLVSGATVTPTGSVSYSWQVSNLAVNAQAYITVMGTVSPTLLPTVFTNTAQITASGIDTNTINNTAAVSLTIGAAPRAVLINEVVTEPQQDWNAGDFIDPNPGGTGSGSTHEWVELYITQSGLNLTGWTIILSGTTPTSPISGTLLAGGAFQKISYTPSGGGSFINTMAGDYLVLGNVDSTGQMKDDITLILKDPNGLIVDQVTLGGGGAPSGNSTNTSDEAIARVPNGGDTDNDAVDFFQQRATLGRSNDIINLEVSKVTSEVGPMVYHGNVTYTLVITNRSPITANNVALVDTLPNELTFTTWLTQNGAGVASDQITWNGLISPSTVITFGFVATHNGNYGDIITNTAMVSQATMLSSLYATATIVADPRIVINEIYARQESDANGNGSTASQNDEFIEFVNNTGAPLDVSGWKIGDATVWNKHTFDAGTIIPNGCAVVVFGDGIAVGSFGNSLVVSSDNTSLGLTDGGDTITLKNGNLIMANYTYGAEGNVNRSLTRDPDITGSAPLVAHTTATNSGGRIYSPGTQVNGAAFTNCAPTVLTMTKSVTPITITRKQEVTYSLVFSNAGLGDALGASFTDTLPSEVDFARWVTQPNGAQVTADSITWTGNISFNQSVTMSFVVTHTGSYGDIVLNTAQLNDIAASATFTVAASTPPVAVADSAITNEDSAVLITVLANDSDIDGNNTIVSSTVTIVTAPMSGTITVNANGTITYTPSADLYGLDVFSYTVKDDGNLTSNVAAVTVTVNSQNDVPLANNDNTTTNYQTAVNVTVLANDILGNNPALGDQPITLTVGAAVNGTVTLNPNLSVTYTPNAGFSGMNSFTYTITDGNGDASNVAIVTVTVGTAPIINPPPVAKVDSYTVTQNRVLVVPVNGVLNNDSDPQNKPLTATVVTNVSSGTLVLNSNGAFTYTPNVGYVGSDYFIYMANNGTSNSNVATVWLTVEPKMNHAPVAVGSLNYTMTESTLLSVPTVTGLLSHITDADGDVLTVTLITPPITGTFQLSPTGSFGYTPPVGFTGTVTLTYQVSDGQGGIITQTATIEVLDKAIPQTNLQVSKVVTPSGEVLLGQVLTYTVRYTNVGPSVAQGVVISDAMFGVNQLLGNLAVGESGQLMFTYQVTSFDLTGITNTVMMSSATLELDPSDNQAMVTNSVTMPHVDFDRSEYQVNEGDGQAVVTLTLNVAPLMTVTVGVKSEDLDSVAGQDYQAISQTLMFKPGQALVTTTVPIIDDTLDEVTETLRLQWQNPQGALAGARNPVTVTIVDNDEVITPPVVVVYTPSITISLSAMPQLAKVGQVITFTYQVTNAGNISLSFVTGHWSLVMGDLSMRELSIGESVTGTFSYTVQPSDFPGPIVTTMQVTGTGGITVVTAAATATVELMRNVADLSLSKAAQPNPVAVNGLLTYTLTITNNGPDLASEVVLTDSLPSGVDLVTSPCVGQTVLTCTLGTLSPAMSQTVLITVRPKVTGTLTNTARVYSPDFDPKMTNNIATATTEVGWVEVQVSMTVTGSHFITTNTVAVGTSLTYTLWVTNYGNLTASQVVLTNHVSLTMTQILTQSGLCNLALVCELGDLAPQSGISLTLVLKLTAAGTLTSGVEVSAEDMNQEAQAETTLQVVRWRVYLPVIYRNPSTFEVPVR